MSLCQCGCGLSAPIAQRNDAKRGYVKGQPVRFIPGHNHRRARTNGDYLVVHRPTHRLASSSGCVPVHFLVAESALGKPLPPRAEIHHVDENRQNNAPRNLVICQDGAYHKLLHWRASVLRAGGNPNTEKVCCDCRLMKPFDQFNRLASNKSNGRQSACRDCSKIRYATARGRSVA